MKSLLRMGPLGVMLLALPGCDEGQLPTAPPKAIVDAGIVVDAATDAGTAIRTVETRNPFGNTAVTNNLMIDGDFELTGRTGQMPWVTFSQSGQSTLGYATGGQCKSGVRCGSIAPGTQLIGYFASPKTDSMTGSVWAHPNTGNCGDVQVQAIDLDNQSNGTASELKAQSQDVNGWCNYTGTIPNLAEKQPVLYISVSDGVAVALIDDAVVLPSADTQAVAHSEIKMSPAMRQRVRFISEWVRAHRRF